MQHFQKRLLPCLCHYLRCPLIYKSGCSHVCRTVITGSRTGREHVPEIFDDTVIIFVYIVRCQREPRQGIMLYLTISHDYHIIATKIFIYLHSVQDFNPVCRIFGIPGPPEFQSASKDSGSTSLQTCDFLFIEFRSVIESPGHLLAQRLGSRTSISSLCINSSCTKSYIININNVISN